MGHDTVHSGTNIRIFHSKALPENLEYCMQATRFTRMSIKFYQITLRPTRRGDILRSHLQQDIKYPI